MVAINFMNVLKDDGRPEHDNISIIIYFLSIIFTKFVICLYVYVYIIIYLKEINKLTNIENILKKNAFNKP